MEKKIIKLLSSIRGRGTGIEVGKNLLLYLYFRHVIYDNAILKKIIGEDLVDILESVQCLLLEIEDGKDMVIELIKKHEVFRDK